ncbi:MAG: PD-(D/E)XK nuclease family protein, partial [bacterium]
GSQEEMMQAMDEGKAIVTEYLESLAREPVTAKTLFVEKNLRIDLGDFVLIGRLDRVDEHEDGTLEIIDYKSGRQKVEAADVADDLAMACYQLLLKGAYPDREVCASILALRSNTRATAALTPGQMEEFRNDLVMLGREILNRDLQGLTPGRKVICP